MPKSIRILTEIGKDKSVQVDLNQEFDHLQILSLQFTQSELYQRMCSDYGVVVGRVSVNNGYGLPNAKVSIFIPLTDEDSEDPIISELYPYKSLNTTNAQGYQYNLLPQTPSYSNHVPTGSFPTKEQIMKDPGWKMVFDKYYKFSVTTNQSGDFMIFGVPLGEQKLVMNIDLSDIGEFSLTPQDMIRMGLATEAEVDGVRFKSSENFKVLPQIVTIVKDVTILPLWGDEDICQSSINRTDFDLSADGGKNLTIQPTAIFMGSLISTLDKYALKRYKGNDQFCRVKLKMGELCKMTAGPGEILAIRHTIQQDSQGRPILEQYLMESNGKVIDGDGTWLVELPMNLNYIITDQFGNQVPSLDPTKGIPTTARYRFKIKWQQPDNFDQDIKRGYFLVPNVKEWGWTTTTDPNPYLSGNIPLSTDLITKSYSFSLDWDDYGDTSSAGQQMIQEAILCEDKFYEFYYNKVYTVSQLIDQYRGGKLNRRYNSIKNILDEECESDVLKFPTNDAQWRPDFLYLLFSIFLRVITPVLIILLVVLHIIGFLLWFLAPIISFIMCVIFVIVYAICQIIRAVRRLLGGNPGQCQSASAQCSATQRAFDKMINDLRYFPLPNLTYPDCEMCNCVVEQADSNANQSTLETVQILNTQSNTQLSNYISSFFYDHTVESASDFNRYALNAQNYFFGSPYNAQVFINDVYEELKTLSSFPQAMASVMAGKAPEDTTGSTLTLDAFCPIFEAGSIRQGNCDGTAGPWTFLRTYFSSNLTMSGRLNLFNTKAKYFNGQIGSLDNTSSTIGFSGFEQAPNQMRVIFNYTANTNPNQYHYDNVFVISCDDGTKSEFTPGRIVTFHDPLVSFDVNAFSASTNNDEGIPSITGSTRITPSSTGTININLIYADPNNPNNDLSTGYVVNSNAEDTEYHRWPIDFEYFQVITAMTISEYDQNCIQPASLYLGTYPPMRIYAGNSRFGNSLPVRYIFNDNLIRVQSPSNITRPDFWTFPDCNFINSIPVWGNASWGTNANATLVNIQQYNAWSVFIANNRPPKALWEVQSPIAGSSVGSKQVLVFLTRGVDPYSTRNENSYDLSILFGKQYGTGPIITGKYKLNIPIQKGLENPRHREITANFGPGSIDTTISPNSGIYYQNFNYTPGNDFSAFTTTNHRYYSAIDRTTLTSEMGKAGNTIRNFKAASITNYTDSILRVKPPNVGPSGTVNVDGEYGGTPGFNQSYLVYDGGFSNNTYTLTNVGGSGTHPRIFLPQISTKVGNLFTTHFDWHVGTNIDPNQANDKSWWMFTQNLWNGDGNRGYIAQYPPYLNLDVDFWNNTEWANWGWTGKFSINPLFWGGLSWNSINTTYHDRWKAVGTGEYADGFFISRLNVDVNGQTIDEKDYENNKGYYPYEYLDGGEVFGMTADGAPAPNKEEIFGAGNYPGLNTAGYSIGSPTYDREAILNFTYDLVSLKFSFVSFYTGIDMRLYSTIYQVASYPCRPEIQIQNLNFVNKDYTVMRTDRLPSSSRTFESRNTNDLSSCTVPLSYVLHNNPDFGIYTFDDDGVNLSAPPISTGQNFPADTSVSGDTVPAFASIIETTNECNKMLPLNCYSNQLVAASGVSYYTITSNPNEPWKEGTCTSQSIAGLGDRMVFDTATGCYQLASRFILSLKIDIELLLEWKSRLDLTFGACRNVFSHLFTNQWINGVLYAYSFKNDKIVSRTNQITGYRYCYDTLFLHPVTNSYFYRSTPWKYDVTAPNNGIFIGKDGNTSSEGGNRKYLNNPTTIIDLGPKTDFLQQLVQNDNFDGYIMKDLKDSTFGDTSDILNFFILSRLLNTNFFSQLFGTKGAGILGLFTRVPRQILIQPPKQKNFIDADVAQMFSINSEIGVDEFEVSNYPFADAMYYNPGNNADETVIGVFFNSTQQVRDFLTPRRTIFNPNTTQASWPTSFGYIPQTKTQYVPFYNWELKPKSIGGLGFDIFGSQQNDWATNNITGYYYQSLDRLNVTQQSNYMSQIPSTPNATSNLFRGYIFGYDPAANLYDADLIDTNPYFTGNYSNNGNPGIPREVITHGAPFHFYFGLKKGKTALDRFLTKYTQDTDLI